MTKKITLLFSFILILTLQGCGITQELDQAITTTTELNTTLEDYKENIKLFKKRVDEIPDAFERDLKKGEPEGLFKESEGDLYRNFTKRQELLETMTAEQKEMAKLKKELQRIISKEAVDVDNEQLELITSSLDIIKNNFDANQTYIETGTSQEEDLYNQLPVDNLSAQTSLIERTYGSVMMASEESITNINYTLSLIKHFQDTAQVPAK